jgi:hypothetical protein
MVAAAGSLAIPYTSEGEELVHLRFPLPLFFLLTNGTELCISNRSVSTRLLTTFLV